MVNDILTELIAGTVGGAFGIIIGQPLDIIKTRAMIGSVQKKNLRNLIHTEGILSPFKGSLIPMIGQGLYSSIAFTTYNVSRMNKFDIFTSGCIGGAASVLVTTPSEVIKIGLQMNTGQVKKGNLRAVVSSIYKKNGLLGFYLGFLPTFIRDVPSTGIYFYGYTKCRERLLLDNNRRFVELIAGGTAGVLSWAFVIPIDVIKSRVQYGGGTMLECARCIYRESGIRGFFRGTLPCLMRAFPVNAATFLAYEETVRNIGNKVHEQV